jgi:spermidine synthase
LIVRPLGDPKDRLTLRSKGKGGSSSFGEVWEVLLGNVVLLSSAALETERAFGQLAKDLTKRRLKTVVVGGLGFGATARGVLDVACEDTRIVVVEKLDAIAELVRGELAHISERALDDPRVELVLGDVADVIARERDVDAILLDVDNGPGWASFRSNARLYADAGLASARCALAPDGSLAVWSGYPADKFVGTLRAAGLVPRIVPLTERGVVRARAYVGARAASSSDA